MDLIYLTGCGRSGTSLTAEMIASSRDVDYVGNIHFWDTVWHNRKRVNIKVLRAIIKGQYGIDVVIDPLKVDLTLIGIYKDLIDTDKRYVMDKANSFRAMHWIKKYFPQARYVFLVRDFRAYIRSAKARRADVRVITESILWLAMRIRMQCFKGRKLILRFEMLHENPEIFVGAIEDFLQIRINKIPEVDPQRLYSWRKRAYA